MPDRRKDDERLDRIDHQLTALTGQVGKLRDRLGDRNTTLMHDLDERYLTIKEAEVLYIPRKEHEQRQKEQSKRHFSYPLIAFAGLTWLTNVALLIHQFGTG